MSYYRNLIAEYGNKYDADELFSIAQKCQSFYINSIKEAESLKEKELKKEAYGEQYNNIPSLWSRPNEIHKQYIDLFTKRNEVEKLNPIEFVKKVAVDTEEENLSSLVASYAREVQASKLNSYTPMAHLHSMLMGAIRRQQEWKTLSNEEKIVAKLFEATKNIMNLDIDIYLDYKNMFYTRYCPSERSLMENYDQDKEVFDSTMATYRVINTLLSNKKIDDLENENC